MCRQLAELRQSITAYATGFDANSLTPSQAGEVVGLCARIEASVASIKALAAARAAESQRWQLEGYRSPADQLAHASGISTAAAKRTLETGRRLSEQPDVASAALAGELSLEQASAVSAGVAANPVKARELIDTAQRSSLPELNEEVARVRAAACDQEARHQAQHDRRSLRRWTDLEGAFQAHLCGVPEDGARLWRMLDPIRRRLNLLHRSDGTTGERLDALDYDAMMLMADIAIGKDSELTLDDLRDLGLFPQIEAAPTSGRPSAHLPTAGAASPASPTAGSDSPASPTAGPIRLRPAGHGSAGGEPAASQTLFSHAPASGLPSADTASDFSPTAAPSHSPADSAPAGPAARLLTGEGAADERDPPPKGRRHRGKKKLAGSPTRVMIRVDLDTLLRGVALDGELCEMAGYGPIPVSVVRDVLASDNPFIIGILTKGNALVGVFHHGRRPNAYQQSALDFIDPGCAVLGCPARFGLQYDHRVDWFKTHYTIYDLMDRLCGHHHRLKTNQGWALVEGRGKRAFVSPDDPRHPRNCHADPTTAATSP